MSNFKTLFEHAMERFNYGGIQVLDYVKIVDTKVEGANEDYTKELKDFKNGDLNLKVLDIVATTAEDGKNKPSQFSVVIGQEFASGIFPRKITVPAKNLKVIGYNTPPSIPDSWKVANKADFTGEPEELKTES